jgi:hypothetical protein
VTSPALIVPPVAGVVLAIVAANLIGDSYAPPSRSAAIVSRPIHPSHQLQLPWGTYSHWIQPWRGYLDTPPASVVRRALGIQFNVEPDEAGAAARLLQTSGIRRARIEVGWGSMDYDDPSRIRPGLALALQKRLLALQAHGIRPLILLNAHEGEPCPLRRLRLVLAEPAEGGARSVRLAPESAQQVVPGHTGLDATHAYRAAETIITSVAPDGTATLAKPLPAALPAGAQSASTLRYLPFAPPYRGTPRRDAASAEGAPNPAYRSTLAGWLRYVDGVTRTVESMLGSRAFDVEIWNELSFGSAFLSRETYLPDSTEGWGDVDRTLPADTVVWLRRHVRGRPRLGIANGFESERPWGSGRTSPRGLTAISKHPYSGRYRLPEDAVATGNRPLDARGRTDGQKDAAGQWHPRFTPTYAVQFPEYFLSGLLTETLIRDLSPRTTYVGETPHGRRTHPPGARAPAIWITETNVDPALAGVPLSAADRRHVQAKSVLRTLAAYVNKGARAVYFFAAKGGDYALIEPSFFDAIAAGTTPQATAGGETMDALRRFVRAFQGPRRIGRRRSLSVLRISDSARRRQFAGDGSARHPSLYDRDVLAVFPFQLSSRRFVVATYVMSRDILHVYDRRDRSPARFDLPPERYRITIGGLPGCRLHAGGSDPVAGTRVAVRVHACRRGVARLELPVTDSPRLVTLDARR